MDRIVSYALDAAKEITVARVSNTAIVPSKDSGEQIADFYEAIFNRIMEIAKNTGRD